MSTTGAGASGRASPPGTTARPPLPARRALRALRAGASRPQPGAVGRAVRGRRRGAGAEGRGAPQRTSTWGVFLTVGVSRDVLEVDKAGVWGPPQAPGPAGRGRWLRAPPGALREGSPAFRPWGAGCPAGTGGSLLTSHDCERRTPVSGASSGKPGRVSSRAPPWFRGAPGGSQPPGSQPSPSPLLSSRLWSRSDFRPSPEPESLCMWVLSTIYHIATD